VYHELIILFYFHGLEGHVTLQIRAVFKTFKTNLKKLFNLAATISACSGSDQAAAVLQR
jgi:hypothetical protein